MRCYSSVKHQPIFTGPCRFYCSLVSLEYCLGLWGLVIFTCNFSICTPGLYSCGITLLDYFMYFSDICDMW